MDFWVLVYFKHGMCFSLLSETQWRGLRQAALVNPAETVRWEFAP